VVWGWCGRQHADMLHVYNRNCLSTFQPLRIRSLIRISYKSGRLIRWLSVFWDDTRQKSMMEGLYQCVKRDSKSVERTEIVHGLRTRELRSAHIAAENTSGLLLLTTSCLREQLTMREMMSHKNGKITLWRILRFERFNFNGRSISQRG
jgi:hypothetical protein